VTIYTTIASYDLFLFSIQPFDMIRILRDYISQLQLMGTTEPETERLNYSMIISLFAVSHSVQHIFAPYSPVQAEDTICSHMSTAIFHTLLPRFRSAFDSACYLSPGSWLFGSYITLRKFGYRRNYIAQMGTNGSLVLDDLG
jgi:hypothetical protein